MFNERQLLALSTLLNEINKKEDQVLKEMLLLTFSHTLEANNLFTRTLSKRNTLAELLLVGFFKHDYQPKITLGEQNVYGTISGQKTLTNCWQKVIQGKEFNWNPFDREIIDGKQIAIPSKEVISPEI